ncbi:hypothetical protein GCM10020358_07220 [Amorphoplanes nipponensis]|uniref:Uncharacterized protein n=1 Tax=Actinoplanes nipponensis TaxID=135950 RepID=A0A919JEL5_9ACTN|nr:hypothetical protein Ani05nite_16560 [Actinoplanes nipponensis]
MFAGAAIPAPAPYADGRADIGPPPAPTVTARVRIATGRDLLGVFLCRPPARPAGRRITPGDAGGPFPAGRCARWRAARRAIIRPVRAPAPVADSGARVRHSHRRERRRPGRTTLAGPGPSEH